MSPPLQPQPRTAELDDIQGLVRYAYKHLTQACFLLLRVKDCDAARAWLSTVPVTNAVELHQLPQTALQIALTSEGLLALGVAADIVERFSAEFVTGMASDANRSRRLGDVSNSDPSRWDWGSGQRVPHVLLMLYAAPGGLDDWQRQVLAECGAGFDHLACLTTADMDSTEPFGFVDGISQPKLDWQRKRAARDEEQLEYTNLTCLGEFLLGYSNEYGGYTDRPLLDAKGDAGTALPRAEDAPDKADLGRNGSYLVMRQLQQDVRGFWQFLDREARGDAVLRERWAEAMVGRTLGGEPLVGRSGQLVPGSGATPTPDLNDFNYQSDPQGVRCPLGAHVRRANPRNADLPPGKPGILAWLARTLGFDAEARDKDLVASTRFHRLLRRGREYGDQVTIAQAVAGAGAGADPGLHFICLGTNIARQFEFVQGAWVIGTKFDGLKSEGDPLLGHRQPAPNGVPTDTFSMPRANGPDQQLCGLPRFITVRGGAYFFLPGIRALRYLTTAP